MSDAVLGYCVVLLPDDDAPRVVRVDGVDRLCRIRAAGITWTQWGIPLYGKRGTIRRPPGAWWSAEAAEAVRAAWAERVQHANDLVAQATARRIAERAREAAWKRLYDVTMGARTSHHTADQIDQICAELARMLEE